ncbi:dihydrodipicolinate synthase family protein [Oceanobacter mangrovi]|uniref:dihydrodipicolinate synthase family protein n=1 Tax=Oceanobacter mangrovi TaxID=2862510 RepID=UPI001C8DD7B7|nr:dihydrodipicolinate synthase family protein [Oceanobacter mangrovi]
MLFNGIYTPVITPFSEDMSINFDAYSQQVAYLASAGVHGLMIGGTTGEYYVESIQERIQLLKTARDVAGKDIQIIFGTGSTDPRVSVELAAAAADNGADCVLIGTPPYSLPTQQELADFALAVDKAAGLPVMLYNYPDRMGINMEAEFFERVFDASENFVAIKESSGDINRLHLLLNQYPELQTACGMDDQALEFFAWGAKGWVCAGSNFLPAEHIALYQACVVENDFNKGRKIMAAMMPLMHVLEQGGKFIQSVKSGVSLAGRQGGLVRPPLQGLAATEEQVLAEVIQVLKNRVAEIVAG